MNAPGGPDRAARHQSFSPRPRGSARAAAGTTGDPGVLTFPDLPRLELDQLLGQVVERAQEVLGTQGRLRGLLRATQVITGDLAMPVVLHRIADGGPGAGRCALRGAGGDRPGRGSGRVRPRRHAGRRGGGDRAAAAGQGAPGCVDRGPATDPAGPHRRRPALVGVPARAPADGQFPGGADPDPGRGVRQPLPDRQHPGAVQRRGRRARHRAGRDRRRRHRQRPPLPGRPLPRGVAAGHRRDHPPAAVPRPHRPGRPDRSGQRRRPAAADRRPQPGDRRRRPGHPGPACRERVRPAGRGGRRRRRRGSARPAGAAAGVAVRAGVHHRAAAAPGPPPRRGRVGVGRLRCPGCRPGAGGAAVWIDPGARGAVGGPDPRPARVHPRRPGDGRRVRQPGRGRDRTGRGPGRAATRRDARRARTDRRGPARPRHPTAVRHRPVPASPGRHPRAGPGRAAGTHRDRRPRRHHRPDPHQHLRAAAEPPDPSARPAGPPARMWSPR